MDNEQQNTQDPDQRSGDKKTWNSGENQFTHMSDEEKKRHLGWNPGQDEMDARERQSRENAADDQSGDQQS